MDGEEEQQQKPHVVAAGDFVWGKLKNQHWWPGQVHHPSSASDSAARTKPKDSDSAVLIAFFGNGTFAWCDAAAVRPFVVVFDSLVRQSNGRGFVTAVAAALDEIERCLEVEMTCNCVAGEWRRKLDRPLVVNAGIRDGVAGPKGRVYGLPVGDLRSPGEFLGRFREVACDVSGVSLLESAVMRSCVAVYWRFLGRYAPLPEWSEWKGIAEDGVEVENVARKGPRGGSRSHYKAKKERSMAELIAETGLDAAAAGGEDEEEQAVAEENPESSVRKSRKKKKEEVKEGVEVANAGGGVEEEGQASCRRERKKSKYLSPPYTMVDNSSKNSGKGSASMRYEEDSETGELSGARPMMKCSMKSFVFEEYSGSVNELLSQLRLTALNSMYLVGNGFDSVIRGFFGRRRSSLYVSGPDFYDYNKSLESPAGGVDVKTPRPETGLFSQEGKPGGFQIVSDLEKCDYISKTVGKRKSHAHDDNGLEETNVKTPGFDINISVEGKSHGVVEGDGLIDVNVICPGLEANGLNDGNRPDGDKPKKIRKRKSVDLEANGSGEPKSRGRPKKKSLSGEIVGSVSIGQVAGGLANGRPEKKGRGRKSKKDEANTDLPSVASCLLQPHHVNSSSPLLPSQSVPKPPLDFVKNSLEKMITTLNESASKGEDAEPTSELKPEAKGKLVDEMNGLLKKVNKLLTTTNTTSSGAGGPPGGST